MRLPTNSANTTCCSPRKPTTRVPTTPPASPNSTITAQIGLQYNPIAIAQYGLGNYNLYRRTGEPRGVRKFFLIADWLCFESRAESARPLRLEPPLRLGIPRHARAPWYSALAQGQGISVLVRAHKESGDARYLDAAQRAFASFRQPIANGGVAFTDAAGDLWFEEYIVSPPTHILNGFIWAAWGVYDYFLATRDLSAQELFARAVRTFSTISTATISDSGRSTSNPAPACPWWQARSIISLHIVQLRDHASADRRRPIRPRRRSLGKLQSQPQQPHPRPVLQKRLQTLLLLVCITSA